MPFHADLHVHSKHSRATSRDLDLEHLAYWARRKGITVVATGDFTHPAWLAELRKKLIPAEPGLYRLREECDEPVAGLLPPACRAPVRFMLSVEISTIYKRGDRTRKIHHLLYAPDLAAAERIAAGLARIGNIASDGRPILGLDSRDLLEITLEASSDAYLVPAHIWTPWFAVLGSQGGFDSIVECYRDLADRIFAVETGLSSDPAMNWRLSLLDRFRLVSNSDAHSPAKLGRETTLFDCDLDYFALRNALATGQGYVGTSEFFPEEGKYHLDGHRKCGVRFSPRETETHGGRCPACGQPVTVGVLNRVEALADRDETHAPPATAGEVLSLVPLPEILSELVGSGPSSKTVEASYARLLAALGPELAILQSVPVEDVARAGSSLLAEAITRLRAGRVIRDAGYDGEYGTIRLFEASELRRVTQSGLLFDALPEPESAPLDAQPEPVLKPAELSVQREPAPQALEPAPQGPAAQTLAQLDASQRAAAEWTDGPLLIRAGPGSGKTRVLTYRIAHLIAERGVDAAASLAITFTRRAAREMRERLERLLPAQADRIAIHTFHSLGLAILREHPQAAGVHRGFRIATEEERAALLAEALNVGERKAESLLRAISKAKRTRTPGDGDVAAAGSVYARELALRGWVDFDDLVSLATQLLLDPVVAAHYRSRFAFVSVDEFQDVDEQQYRLLTLLAPPPDANVCVIGDPNQAIYAFRGADASCFERFKRDYAAAVVTLARNYRSSGTIVAASSQVVAAGRGAASEPSDSSENRSIAEVVRDLHERIALHTAPTERAEAEMVVQTIERLIGGHSFFSVDSGRATGGAAAALAFGDFAVLYRTAAQSAALVEALARSGIPFKQSSHDALAGDPAVRALLEELGESAHDRGGEGLTAQVTAALERLQSRRASPARPDSQLALARLLGLAADCARDGRSLADAVALASDTDLTDPRADRVSLLTLHAAKGLEFSVVFIVGLEDGVLPLHWGELDPATEAEERRLFYVGMTRAKDRLVLSRALQRRWRGRLRKLAASPYLADIEAELVRHQRPQLPSRKPDPRDDQLRLL